MVCSGNQFVKIKFAREVLATVSVFLFLCIVRISRVFQIARFFQYWMKHIISIYSREFFYSIEVNCFLKIIRAGNLFFDKSIISFVKWDVARFPYRLILEKFSFYIHPEIVNYFSLNSYVFNKYFCSPFTFDSSLVVWLMTVCTCSNCHFIAANRWSRNKPRMNKNSLVILIYSGESERIVNRTSQF